MISWTQLPWFGFDTETTGVVTNKDRIIQAAIVQHGGNSRVWLINPGVPIPERSQAIHHITDAQVQAEGVQPRVALPEIAAILLAAKDADAPIVAYNGAFDLQILISELLRHGYTDLAQQLQTDFYQLIDPLIIDRHFEPYRRGKRNLSTLSASYGIVPEGNFHDALADVKATLELLAVQVQKYPQLAELDLRSLYQLQVESYAKWAESMREWHAKQGRKSTVEPRWDPVFTVSEAPATNANSDTPEAAGQLF